MRLPSLRFAHGTLFGDCHPCIDTGGLTVVGNDTRTGEVLVLYERLSRWPFRGRMVVWFTVSPAGAALTESTGLCLDVQLG